MADQEEDFSSLPFSDRFVNKVSCMYHLCMTVADLPNQNWKVRKQAYEDAAKEFEKTPDESHPVFKPFLQDSSLWKAAVADSNVAAQQDAITALCAFLKYGGTQACLR